MLQHDELVRIVLYPTVAKEDDLHDTNLAGPTRLTYPWGRVLKIVTVPTEILTDSCTLQEF